MAKIDQLLNNIDVFLEKEVSKSIFPLIFLVLLIVHLFIFRDILLQIPNIISGKSVIVRDELVPFFDFNTQFLSQIINEGPPLTLTDEVRVAYSFWFSWVRYYQFLPFALIIINTIASFILFYAFYIVLSNFYKKKSNHILIISTASSFIIHFILLYTKITHFYALVIGFSLFALSISIAINQIFFQKKISKKNIILISLITLFNPSIHYHILFYIVFALLLFIQQLLTLFDHQKQFINTLRKNLIYSVLVILLTAIPYGLFIKFITSQIAYSVSDSIPVNYWMIMYSSSNLNTLFSLDSTSQVDMYLYGNYLNPDPRYIKIIILCIVILSLFYFRFKSFTKEQKLFLLASFMVFLFAIWTSMGFFYEISFHTALQRISLLISESRNSVTNLISNIITISIQILRYPHRFNLIQFYFIGLLLAIGLLELRNIFLQKSIPKIFILPVTLFIVFISIFHHVDYGRVFFSGNFNDFLTPYPIPDDLKQIKSHLATKNEVRLFILPTLESGREIVKDNTRFSFIDKFLIYYINQPTFYYGTGANAKNKILSFSVYKALLDGDSWWDEVLSNNLEITHILYPKNLSKRAEGLVYLPAIDSKIQPALYQNNSYRLVFSGTDYDLFERTNESPQQSLLLNYKWSKLKEVITALSHSKRLNNFQFFFPIQSREFLESDGEKIIVTENIERSYYDLYFPDPKIRNYFDANQIPFTKDFVHSSFYTSNALSINTLNTPSDNYNFFKSSLPSLVNLQTPNFIGFSNNNLSVKTTIDKDSNYRFVIRAASFQNSIPVSVNGLLVDFKSVEKDTGTNDQLDFTYYIADISLREGAYNFEVINKKPQPILVEFLGKIEVSEFPLISEQSIKSKYLQITKEGDYYKVSTIN